MGAPYTNGADTGRSATIVKAAYEGSDLAVDWSPNGSGIAPNGLFPAMISQVKTVMTNDAANGEFDVLGGLYWYQGESDTIPTGAKSYQKHLTKFIQAFRKALPITPSAPVVLAKEDITDYVSYLWSTGRCDAICVKSVLAGNAQVRAADDWAAANLQSVVKVDSFGLARNAPVNIHLINSSELTIGQQMATVSESLLP